ncbi:MAG TPA: hypothetical protein VIL40_05395 [Thermaerobacter sp.]
MGSMPGGDGRPRRDGRPWRDGVPRRDGRPREGSLIPGADAAGVTGGIGDVAAAVGLWIRATVAGLRRRATVHAWRIRQAIGVAGVGVTTAAAVELARRAGAPGWGMVVAAFLPALAGAWWFDHRWRARARDEEHRQRLVEAVLDEFRSRATAVTLAAGMLRRPAHAGQAAGEEAAGGPLEGRDPGERLAARPSEGAAVPAVGDGSRRGQLADGRRGDAADGRRRQPDEARGVPSPAARRGQPEAGYRGHALAHLEAEAEMLRVGALQLACWLRLHAGRVRPERERVDLAAVAERVARRLAVVAQARQVRLGFTGFPGPAAVVRGDRALLELLCTSLVAAALDRHRPGGHLTVSVDGDGAAVILCVADGALAPIGDGAQAGEVTRAGAAGGDPVPRGRSGGDGPDGGNERGDRRPAGYRWRRGGTGPLALELTKELVVVHGGRWRVGSGLPWIVELPAALGPFAVLRPTGGTATFRPRRPAAATPGAKGRGVVGLGGPSRDAGRPPVGGAGRYLRPVRPVSERCTAAWTGGSAAVRTGRRSWSPPPAGSRGDASGPRQTVRQAVSGWQGPSRGQAPPGWHGLVRGMLGLSS